MPPTLPHRLFSRRAALAHLARFAASVPAAATLSASVAREQPPETPPEEGPQQPAAVVAPPGSGDPVPEAELVPQGLDETEGYAGWKHHIGKPDEGVCHVTVTVFDGGTSGAGQTVREGSGIIVRCDGWILLPEALFGSDRALQKTAKISIGFRAADGTPPAEPLAPFGPPRYHSAKTDYVLVKVNGHHFKGLHLLDVLNLLLQMPVSVVWAAPAPMPAKEPGKNKPSAPLLAPARNATVGARDPNTSVPHFALTFAPPLGADDLPPLGAAVIEPSCGAVLGIVTVSDAKGVWFSPFGYFRYVSNDVPLKVSIEDITQPTTNAAGSVTGTGQILSMVKVFGGPTRLVGELANNYRFFYGTDVVCMPDFYIDAYPVTVGAYRDWLGPVGGLRQPLGWVGNNELKTHDRNPNIPISGLIADDGLRYAAAHKKRVATPVEWARATMGADTKWIAKLKSEWDGIHDAQTGIANGKAAAYQSIIVQKAKTEGKNNPRYRTPLALAAPQPELAFFDAQQIRLYKSYWDKGERWFPYQHCPVGFYKEDVSKWGVRDVVSNAPEMCQPNYAARVFELAHKPYATIAEPFFSRCSVYTYLGNCANGDIDENYCLFAAGPDDSRNYVWFHDGLYVPREISAIAQTGFGVRCAL